MPVNELPPGSSRPPHSEAPTLEVVREVERGPWSVEIGSPSRSSVAPLQIGGSLVLGSGRGADLTIDDPTVSGRHARLGATPSGVYVEDLGSKNGVYVVGARVPGAWLAGTPASFVLGRTTVTVQRLPAGESPVPDVAPIPGLIGSSGPMRRLATEVRRCASLRAPVLLQGESGSGKDVVAGALHRLSRRAGPYVPLNVGAIPESLADAELFGYRRGAFTGAVAARPGAFEEAHRGTLFLDEIADLPPGIQVKLLRVVEDHHVRPLGGSQPLEVDVRVVSATWARLEDRVAEGSFREDLYHRISTFVIRLPPLRARKSDIPPLAASLLGRIQDEVGPKKLGTGALARLVAHSWPGNVRELSSVLYRAAVSAQGLEIDTRDVEAALVCPSKVRPRALSEVEASALLGEHRGNASAAARAAGVPRSTFRSWLEKA
jgi:transcriptional regulator with PAS, ATPase and Fis domain